MASDFSSLLRAANRISGRAPKKELPGLLFLTDPARTPDPIALLKNLPRSARGQLAVVYRHFGAPNRLYTARALLRICRINRWKLLIGADPALAARIGADGVHLPERMAKRAGTLKRRRPKWKVTLAAHSAKTFNCGRGLDGLLVSPVFETASPSAAGRKCLKKQGLARAAKNTPAPLYALGGINARTINKLRNIPRVAGVAITSGLKF